jgi:pyruvate/2-oxoglutarate dehydrogenase complex dihydrolipoamide dehydrogenase (E3) component
MLLLLRNRDTFHKYRSGRIYIIGDIVSHMMLTTITVKDTSRVRPLMTSMNNRD